MIEIEVQGFQSIAHSTIKVDGFTALVGRSNIGKSAFVRAVKYALTNPVGTSFVRHRRGCTKQPKKKCDCQTTVRIKTDGFDLLWEKGDKVNRYEFNGKSYDKPDRGTPEFLTGMSPIKLGDKNTFLQVADQFSPVFLLDQPGTTIAETISDVSKLDCINTATKLVEKERREVSSTKKVREADVASLVEKIAAFDTLEEKALLLKKAEATLLEIEALIKKRDALAGYLATLSNIKKSLQSLDALSKIPAPDDAVVVSSLPKAALLHDFVANLARRQEQVAKLAGVEGVKSDFDESSLTHATTSVRRFEAWLSQLRVGKSFLESFGKVSALGEIDFAPLLAVVTRASSMIPYLSKMQVLPSTIGELEAKVKTLSDEEKKAQEALGAIEFCPTCSRPVKEGHSHVETVVSV